MFFRGWNRLEGRSRTNDFAEGLAAKVADGLWMLGRQWQMRELKGEDGGTPVDAEVTYERLTLDEVKLGRRSDAPFVPIGSTPVEVQVEREVVLWDWRLRIRAGQQFERLARSLLGTTAAGGVISPLYTHLDTRVELPPADSEEWRDLDLASRRFVRLMAGRAINGEKLYAKIKGGQLTFEIGNVALRNAFLAWYDNLYSVPEPGNAHSAWDPERLDYSFRLKSSQPGMPGPLHAASYRAGEIDWETFSIERLSDKPFPSTTVHVTPTHAMYGGQPMRRWWEFENAAVNFGAMNISKTDLSQMVFLHHGLTFGDDWFVIPLQAEPGSYVRIASLKVKDVFGQETLIPHARDVSGDAWNQWQVFALGHEAPNGQTADFLFVPPVVGSRDESPVLEAISFAKDEDANVVFGIESVVPNQIGDPVDGFAAHLEAQRRWRAHLAEVADAAATEMSSEDATPSEVTEPTATPASAAAADVEPATLRYVLATKVPQNWIPFIASDVKLSLGVPNRSVRLRRAEMVSTEAADEKRKISALTRLLGPDDGTGVEWLMEEAVGRAGVRVELKRQRARGVDGATYVWFGRKIAVGKGEARSGLGFDAIKDIRAE
jgi:hypothetical protein